VNLITSRYSRVKGSCEDSNEYSRSIKGWESLDCVGNYQLLKKDSTPLS
jgi:hypothetical protein